MDATRQQREKYLRPLVEGRWTRCLAMTEETGGSDLSLMRTTATRRADGTWTLTGSKFMIGNAADADVAVVLARAEGECEGGPTFFVFPTTTPGWRVGQRLHGMDPGYRAYEVFLEDIELTDDDIVGGPAEIGGAIGQVTEHMAYGRIAMAARAVGLAAFALDTARGYADRRISAGGKLSEKQYVREFIVSSDVKVEAARALVRQAADALDEGRVAARDAAIAKLFATESACEVVDAAIQTLGARGWLTEYGLERVYREVRGFRIADGASEVLKETIFFLPPTAPFRVG
jgi:alkylation response protein AidB-like acyl-CoA dehydrogenase